MSDVRLLIVDDDPHVSFVAARALERLARCDCAASIAEANRALARETYDVVLIDLTLPDGSGMSLLDTLRDRWPHSIPVMLSGISDLTIAHETLAKGALGYIVKPFRVRDLRIQVAAALAVAQRSTVAAGASARTRVLAKLAPIVARSEPVACVVVDLERMPLVGASFGAAAIARVCECFEERLAELDPGLTALGQLGPSSFAACLRIPIDQSAGHIARSLQRVLSAPVMHGHQRIPVGTRLGVVVASPGEAAESVLGLAEAAADAAHESELPFVVYDTGSGVTARLQIELLADATTAIHRGDLQLAYQPQWDLETGACVGVEALARWRHPVRGDIPPDVFVPLAERLDLIHELGTFVLRTACRDVAALRRRGHKSLRVSVNVSALELNNPGYPRVVALALAEAGMSPSALRLEVTESIALNQSDELDRVLRGLQEIGVQLSVDDFGTGYSSFDNLARIAWSEIKLDRCITVQSKTAYGREMLRSIIAFGSAVGIEVIAEGIETEAELDDLRGLGCRYGQGFLLGRPQSLAAIAEQLDRDLRAGASYEMLSAG